MTLFTKLPSYFQLEENAELIVPPWFVGIFQDSRNAESFPTTPKFLLFEKVGGNQYAFVDTPKSKGSPAKGCRRLFVPGNIRMGDVLVIQWVEENRRSAQAIHRRDSDKLTLTPRLPALNHPTPNYQVPNCS